MNALLILIVPACVLADWLMCPKPQPKETPWYMESK